MLMPKLNLICNEPLSSTLRNKTFEEQQSGLVCTTQVCIGYCAL